MTPTGPTEQMGRADQSSWVLWYVKPIKKWFVFRGRASRKEYWIFTCTNVLIVIALLFIEAGFDLFPNSQIFVVSNLFLFVITAPSLAVSVRRFHDTNHSAWWLLMGLVPFVGGILQLITLASASDQGPNQYGPNPYGLEMTSCPQCGNQTRAGNNFCNHCGTRLGARPLEPLRV